MNLLLMFIVLGFIAVFPDVFELKDMMLSEYAGNQQKIDRLEKSQYAGNQQKVNILEKVQEEKNMEGCPLHPATHIASAPNTSTESINTDREMPKLLINRDPIVFDDVCSGDTLKYHIYQENVDRIIISYENKNPGMGAVENRLKLTFQNQITFIVPLGWYGETTITAMGSSSRGEIRLSMNKVTFNVKPHNNES